MVVGDPLLHFHELVAAGGLHLLWEMAVELRCRGVGLEGVGEHADALKPPLPGEVDHLLKLRLGLAGEAGDERRPEDKLGDPLPQLAEQVLGRLPRHAPLHPLEDRVAGMLERHVEIGDDFS